MNRWLCALAIAAALGGAQGARAGTAPETAVAGWTVLEKLGRVRYRPAGDLRYRIARSPDRRFAVATLAATRVAAARANDRRPARSALV